MPRGSHWARDGCDVVNDIDARGKEQVYDNATMCRRKIMKTAHAQY